MSIEFSSVLGHPRPTVYAWHTRPGALQRLLPPWQPLTPVREAPSLADGHAVLGLPGGLRWVARHDPTGFRPPQQFVDTWAFGALQPWRHVHEFLEHDGDTTLMRDRVTAPVPAALLRPMFTYRHRQLADDLAIHRDAAQRLERPLTIAVTGSSGLVGTALCALLSTGGHRVVRLIRGGEPGADERIWDPDDPSPDLLDGVDGLVHLAGASIAGRFTEAHKAAIRDSRIGPTRRLAEVAARASDGPSVFVSASAVGFYGADRGDEVLTEDSAAGSGFLAEVVRDWEAATGPAADAGVRVVRVRTGIVQAARGGTLRLLRPLFSAGLGGRLGDGEQWLSWIGIDDLTDIHYRALFDDRLSGPVNAVAPQPVRNSDYTAALARTLHRPAVLPVPSFGPRTLLGAEGVTELAEASQRVQPTALSNLGHRFRHPTIAAALAHQLGRA
ncbi:TIGR01777 family oxidoreductase [Mycolicibacterium confluentis]|uniref:TIGR01777 family oxidoreductase n=1 Tax=Mycolicibacterium confluentis TaxID=28047 RepID=UPI000A14816E|nr:TIGR01777 family oxidoreductase [Mycolicibacterium confluentis]MCV7317932.1 TIGR01777 family protein [Mycolicibacterium confluentis]ORV22948.1 nucleoside-diphosphate sugar epimerase [Mycolicibacterium confluentis]